MKNDGGPAFPRSAFTSDSQAASADYVRTKEQEGMTLRDYFAAKVMQSCFAGEGARMIADRDSRYDENEGNWAKVVALNSYEMADAMLKARGK